MSFRFKTILGIALIESVLLLILVISGLEFLTSSNEDQLRQRAETTSRLFANATKDAVLANDLATLESFVEEILGNPDIVYVRISNPDVVLSEGGDPATLVRPHRPDRRLEDVGDGVFDVRTEIREAGILYGVIEMGLSTRPIEGVLGAARRWAAGIAVLEVVLVAVFSFVLGTYLTRQLHRLRQGTDEIATLGPGPQLPVAGSDELADVARAFNNMSRRLAQTYRELEQSLENQKTMVAAARRNEAKNQAILSASLDGIISIDHHGRVVDYNQAAAGIFGWQSRDILGQSMAEHIIPPEARTAHARGMAHFLATGEGPVLDRRLVMNALHKDGHTLPVEIAISTIADDDGPLFTAFVRDVSARLAAETELRLAAKAFESSEPMFICDPAARVIRVNQAFTQITGYDADEVLGRTPGLFQAQDEEETVWASLVEAGEWNGEVTYRRRNGEAFPGRQHISAVTDADGVTTHYIALFVDISEQKRNEERLRQARRQAEQASEAKSRFLAAMSHEIRTPLNAVLGILGLLRETALEERQTRLVQTAQESGRLLLSVINDILDFSKMEAGKFHLQHRCFDLHRVITSTVDLLQAQAAQKHLALLLDLEPELPRYAWGDAERLRQVLLNLVGNAVKFTPSGRVVVRSRAGPLDDGRFAFACSVEDTGIGISEEQQARLFEEFTMADQGHARAHGGTGLGLAITKRLVDLMGGTIEVHSRPWKGSTFRFDIPLASATAADFEAEDRATAAAGHPPPGTRVLLVEDNAANQEVIKSILETAELDIDIVSNGADAVAAVARERYSAVLMDISMPGMDGIEATREIRRLGGAAAATPIIALTAHALEGDRERFLAQGLDDYLTKPLEREQALRCLGRWTDPAKALSGPAAESHEPFPRQPAASPPDIEITEAYIDEAVLERLARDTSPALVPQLLAGYEEDARARVEKIGAAVAAGDVETLEYECHTLASSAAAHGNARLHDVVRRVELLCRSGALKEACDRADKIRDVAEESFTRLAQRASQGFGEAGP